MDPIIKQNLHVIMHWMNVNISVLNKWVRQLSTWDCADEHFVIPKFGFNFSRSHFKNCSRRVLQFLSHFLADIDVTWCTRAENLQYFFFFYVQYRIDIETEFWDIGYPWNSLNGGILLYGHTGLVFNVDHKFDSIQ